MSFGRYSGFPIRFGGTADSPLEKLETSYLEDHGTAFNTDSLETYLSCESIAIARALEYMHRCNGAYTAQGNPRSLTGAHLERWEQILNVIPSRADSSADRRAEIRRRIQFLSLPCTLSYIRDFCTDALGDAFLDLRVATYNDPNTCPMIDQEDGLNLIGLGAESWIEGLGFTSPVATIRIIADFTFEDFARLKKRLTLLNDWLPAWMDWEVTSDNAFLLDTLGALDRDHLS